MDSYCNCRCVIKIRIIFAYVGALENAAILEAISHRIVREEVTVILLIFQL